MESIDLYNMNWPLIIFILALAAFCALLGYLSPDELGEELLEEERKKEIEEMKELFKDQGDL